MTRNHRVHKLLAALACLGLVASLSACSLPWQQADGQGGQAGQPTSQGSGEKLAASMTALVDQKLAGRDLSPFERRVEIADDLHMGIARRDVWALDALETLAWSLPAVMSAGAAIYLALASVGGRANALTLTVTRLPPLLAALLTCQIGVAMGVASIAERQLFTFFKNRG